MEEEMKYVKSDKSLTLGVIEEPITLMIDSNFNRIVTVHSAYKSLSLNDKVVIIEDLHRWIDYEIYLIKNQLLNEE